MKSKTPLFKNNDRAAAQLIRQYAQDLRSTMKNIGARAGEEAYHQLRVESRRLQLMMKMFKKWLPPTAQKIRRDLRWLRHQVDETRDLTVQRKTLEMLRSHNKAGSETFWSRVEAELNRRTPHARHRVTTAIRSRRCADLLNQLLLLISQKSLPGGKPVKKTFRKKTRKFMKRVRACGLQSNDKDLHRLRKDLKKLRYALEPCVPIMPSGLKKGLKRVKQLQNVLGEHQDLVVTDEFLREVGHDGANSEDFVIFKDVLTRRKKELRWESKKAWRKFIKKERKMNSWL